MTKRSTLMVMVREGVTAVTKFLHISSTFCTTTLSLFYPYASLIMTIMCHFSW